MEITKNIKVSFIVLVTAVLISCGGGGDGGGGGPSYNGITTKAVVDSNNDEAFSDTAYIGSGSGSALGGSVEGGNSNKGSSLKGFAKSFGTFAKNFDFQDAVEVSPNAAVLDREEIGECGGSAVYSGNSDDVTGDFSGSLSFNNLDDCDGVINGSVTFSGNGDVFSMTFSNLSFTDDTNSIAMNGTVTATENGLVTTIVMNVDFSDNNKTYRVEDLTIVSTQASLIDYSSSDVITGRVYHPDYGYVELTTPTPVYTPQSSMYPTSGVVVMSGVGSTATITFNVGGYVIELDENNDAIIDETSDCTWESDNCIVSAS